MIVTDLPTVDLSSFFKKRMTNSLTYWALLSVVAQNQTCCLVAISSQDVRWITKKLLCIIYKVFFLEAKFLLSINKNIKILDVKPETSYRSLAVALFSTFSLVMFCTKRCLRVTKVPSLKWVGVVKLILIFLGALWNICLNYVACKVQRWTKKTNDVSSLSDCVPEASLVTWSHLSRAASPCLKYLGAWSFLLNILYSQLILS